MIVIIPILIVIGKLFKSILGHNPLLVAITIHNLNF